MSKFRDNAERNKAIRAAINASPDASNRAVARRVGCSQNTVKKVRQAVQENEQMPVSQCVPVLNDEIKSLKSLVRSLRSKLGHEKSAHKHSRAVIREMVDDSVRYRERIRQLMAERDHRSQPSSGTFTKKEIRDLIQLCHPDRHQVGGKREEAANRLTRKLVGLR